MAHLILVRHGQSSYNAQDKWAGHLDEPLSNLGEQQARHAGQALKKLGIHIDMAFVSKLQRAEKTLKLILEEIKQDPPIMRSHALDERDVGDLVGVKIADADRRYGKELVTKWRFTYDARFPNGESLADVHKRAMPYLEEHIFPLLRKGKNVLVVSHKATLRTIIIALEKIPHERSPLLTMHNAAPRVYEYDDAMSIISVHEMDLETQQKGV